MFDRFAKNEGGSIAVETALVMSFVVVPLLLGLWDVAQIGLGQSQVQEALQDAVTYVAAGNAGNTAGITSAAQSAYGTAISIGEHGLLLRENHISVDADRRLLQRQQLQQR